MSVDDRGFLFGDGVYEVFRATDGALFAADRHLRRLANGLAELEFARPAALEDAAGPTSSPRRTRRPPCT